MGFLYIATLPSGKSYIGITATSMRRRKILHLSHARTGRAGALQRAIRKYGATSLSLRVLVIADDWKFLCEMERRAIAAFRTKVPCGYNLTDGGEGIIGVERTEKTRRAMSAARVGKQLGNQHAKGYRHTKEALEKIAAAGRGRVFSETRRAKIGATKKGNKYAAGREYTPEQRQRISEAVKATLARKRTANGINVVA